MDLRYSAWSERVKQYATRVLREHNCSEDRSFIHVVHECRTPPEFRPSWAKPALKLKLPDSLLQFEQVEDQSLSQSDTQPITQQDGSDFLE